MNLDNQKIVKQDSPALMPRLVIKYTTAIYDSLKDPAHVANTDVSVFDNTTQKTLLVGSPSDCLAFIQTAISGILIDERNF